MNTQTSGEDFLRHLANLYDLPLSLVKRIYRKSKTMNQLHDNLRAEKEVK